MSAADLFKDAHDVEFRLRGTHIVIGRMPFKVNSVGTHFPDVRDTVLYLTDHKDEVVPVELGRLPLSALTYCPHGYYRGLWLSRGPSRNRYQGITPNSLWGVCADGAIESGIFSNVGQVLRDLCNQPTRRRPGKRPSGTITRDVHIDQESKVLVQGVKKGDYVGENTVLLKTKPDIFTERFLDNAKLKIAL